MVWYSSLNNYDCAVCYMLHFLLCYIVLCYYVIFQLACICCCYTRWTDGDSVCTVDVYRHKRSGYRPYQQDGAQVSNLCKILLQVHAQPGIYMWKQVSIIVLY